MTPLDFALWLVTVLSWLGVIVVFGIAGFAVACVLGVVVYAGREILRGFK